MSPPVPIRFREIGLSINGLLEIGDRLPVANYRKLVPKYRPRR